jgi:hypothetical protein
MEKNVTFRFFQIGREDEKETPFVDGLRHANTIPKGIQRQRQVGADFVIRLEEFEDSGPDNVVGEIVRVQSTNMPSEVNNVGRFALSTNNPLGHGVIFMFNHKKGILCIQNEPRIVSSGRLIDYVRECGTAARYSIAPMIRPNAWKNFGEGTVRKFAVRIAKPELLADVGTVHQSSGAGIRNLGSAYDAPSIKIEFSMGGGRKGSLSEAIKGFAEYIFNATKDSNASIESMNAVVYHDDTRDEIDLIEQRLKCSDSIDLHDRDPNINYQLKKSAIIKAMQTET